jgi:predicted PurR-regulated permease PerM
LTLFGLGTADAPLVGLIPAASYLGLHAIESNFVTPAILGARFTMNPVLILLTITALIDHLGRPNLIGFIFGEPLFHANVLDLSDEG